MPVFINKSTALVRTLKHLRPWKTDGTREIINAIQIGDKLRPSQLVSSDSVRRLLLDTIIWTLPWSMHFCTRPPRFFFILLFSFDVLRKFQQFIALSKKKRFHGRRSAVTCSESKTPTFSILNGESLHYIKKIERLSWFRSVIPKLQM